MDNVKYIPHDTRRAIADMMAIQSLIANINISDDRYLEDLKELVLDHRRSYDAHVEEDLRTMEILSTLIWACNHALDESKGEDQ